MKTTHFKKEKLLSITLLFTTLFGLVSIRPAHAVTDCRTIPSVVESANPYANNRMGGHLNKHIFSMQAPPTTKAEGATLYERIDDWLAVWDAYKQKAVIAVPDCSGGKVDPKVKLYPIVRGHTCLTQDPLNKTQCTKLDPTDFKPKEHVFVFDKKNGKWIILTAFPKK